MPMSSARPRTMPARPIALDPLEESVEVERRASSQIATVSRNESFGTPSSFVPQLAQKCPFGIELGRRTQLDHPIACDAVDAHPRPQRAFGLPRAGNPPQQRDHPQLFDERRI